MSPILLQLLSFFDFRTLKLKVVSSSKTSVPHLFTPWSRILIKNLTGSQLVKKFPAFYGNLHFITAFTSASHLFQSWITYIQSMSLHSTSWRSTLILSSHLRLYLPSGLFPSGFSTRTLYTPLLFPIRATWTARLILLDLITRITFGDKYRSFSSSLPSFLHSPVTSSLLGPNILLRTNFQ